MLDIKLIRGALDEVVQKLSTRGFVFDKKTFLELEKKRKQIQVSAESLQHQRNDISKKIGLAKKSGEDASTLLSEVSKVNNALKNSEQQLQQVQGELHDILAGMPNIPHHSVPLGTDETANIEIKKFGTVRQFDFPVRDHIQIGEVLGAIDFAAAAKLTGSRFVVMSGPVARLQRALIQFMLDTHTLEHGYEETYVPYIVNADSLFGTGQLPKFKQDLFSMEVTDTLTENATSKEYFLIPTAEVPVTNLVRGEIVAESQLPIKKVAHTPCFRSEAGSYGRDTKGLIRQHQFEKVELVQLVKAENSDTALEELTNDAQVILQKLELPYRVMSLCTGDIGFSAAKTYDLEVWLPSQQTYREISSCSNFADFQCRRMQARWRSAGGKPELLHSLNGSGLAVGRTLVAVLENYQNADGSVTVPTVLVPYMNGVSLISSH